MTRRALAIDALGDVGENGGASVSRTGLSQQAAEPVSRLGPSGFDPSRDDLIEVAVLLAYRTGFGDGLRDALNKPGTVGEYEAVARSARHIRAAIATEARRAETENTGSVHEGAGPKDIAQ